MMTLQQALQQARASNIPLDAERLLCHVLQKNRAYLHTFPEVVFTAAQTQQWQILLQRLQDDEPLAYLLGEQTFWGLDFYVDSAVLIPRPATECLVQAVLAHCTLASARILELGTGSGALACAIAHERPQWQICAVDNSAAALAVAQRNQQRHQLNNIEFINSDWYANVPTQPFDVIVSNPPYIDVADPAVDTNVRAYEPHNALFADEDGLAALRTIIHQAPRYLTEKGLLMLEHGYQQQEQVIALLSEAGFRLLLAGSDGQQLPRYVVAVQNTF